jgi:hypothetical protein
MLFVRGDGVILVSPPMRAGVWQFCISVMFYFCCATWL